MLSNFKYYFGFVAEEIFDVGLFVLWLWSQSPHKLQFGTLWEYSIFLFRNAKQFYIMFWFCSGWVLLPSAYSQAPLSIKLDISWLQKLLTMKYLAVINADQCYLSVNGFLTEKEKKIKKKKNNQSSPWGSKLLMLSRIACQCLSHCATCI